MLLAFVDGWRSRSFVVSVFLESAQLVTHAIVKAEGGIVREVIASTFYSLRAEANFVRIRNNGGTVQQR